MIKRGFADLAVERSVEVRLDSSADADGIGGPVDRHRLPLPHTVGGADKANALLWRRPELDVRRLIAARVATHKEFEAGAYPPRVEADHTRQGREVEADHPLALQKGRHSLAALQRVADDPERIAHHDRTRRRDVRQARPRPLATDREDRGRTQHGDGNGQLEHAS